MSKWSWLFEKSVRNNLHYEDCIGQSGCICSEIDFQLETVKNYQGNKLKNLPIIGYFVSRQFDRSMLLSKQRESFYRQIWK